MKQLPGVKAIEEPEPTPKPAVKDLQKKSEDEEEIAEKIPKSKSFSFTDEELNKYLFSTKRQKVLKDQDLPLPSDLRDNDISDIIDDYRDVEEKINLLKTILIQKL